MAEVVVRYRTDDMEDEEVRATETITISLDGEFAELDLGAKNATKIRATMGTWLARGRRVKAPTRATRARTSPSPSSHTAADKKAQDAAIRTWAKANGIPVNPRGAVAGAVRKAFDEAHASPIAPEVPVLVAE